MQEHDDEFLLSCYLDGTLSVDQAARVEEQLRVRAHLARQLEVLRRVDGLVKRLGGPAPIDAAAFQAALCARLALERAPRRPLHWVWRLAPLGAAAVLLLALTWVFWSALPARTDGPAARGPVVVAVAVHPPVYTFAHDPPVVRVRLARGDADARPVQPSSRLMIVIGAGDAPPDDEIPREERID